MNFGRGNAQKRPGECEKATVNKELDDIELHPKRALRGRMPSENMKPEWKDINIQRPATSGHYLVYDSEQADIRYHVGICWWGGDDDAQWSAPRWAECSGCCWTSSAELLLDSITHWAKLPEGPH
jgi:hypothetical protein